MIFQNFALVAALTCHLVLSSVVPAWYDEFFTFSLAKKSSVDIWQALNNGLETQPPLHYWVVKMVQFFFGDSLFAARLPSIIGLHVGSIIFSKTLFDEDWRSLHLLILLSNAGKYAYEARPYALMFFWLAVAVKSFFSQNKPLLFFSVLFAGWTHYYALLLPFWFALLHILYYGRISLFYLIIILGSLPLVNMALKAKWFYVTFVHFAKQSVLNHCFSISYYLFTPPICFAFVSVGSIILLSPKLQFPKGILKSRFMMLAMLLLPFCMVIVGVLTMENAFHFRYIIYAATSTPLLLALLCSILPYSHRRIAHNVIALICILYCCKSLQDTSAVFLPQAYDLAKAKIGPYPLIVAANFALPLGIHRPDIIGLVEQQQFVHPFFQKMISYFNLNVTYPEKLDGNYYYLGEWSSVAIRGFSTCQTSTVENFHILIPQQEPSTVTLYLVFVQCHQRSN